MNCGRIQKLLNFSPASMNVSFAVGAMVAT